MHTHKTLYDWPLHKLSLYASPVLLLPHNPGTMVLVIVTKQVDDLHPEFLDAAFHLWCIPWHIEQFWSLPPAGRKLPPAGRKLQTHKYVPEPCAGASPFCTCTIVVLWHTTLTLVCALQSMHLARLPDMVDAPRFVWTGYRCFCMFCDLLALVPYAPNTMTLVPDFFFWGRWEFGRQATQGCLSTW